MGRLTTHVLDTSHGKPAAGMKIELGKFEREGLAILRRIVTNDDGRTDEPLLEGDDMLVGKYELIFHVGELFRATWLATLSSHAFWTWSRCDFGIADHNANYHVPLLCSQWSYSTYRGS